MRWTSLGAPLAVTVGLVTAPGGAQAAGGPVPPVQGRAISVAGSSVRFAAFAAGHDTLIKRLGARSPASLPELRIAGRYGIPGVDYAGATTGLAADGHILILARVTGNGRPRATPLVVLNTRPLSIRARLDLPGWWTVDAISPDGRWLYLIHYPSSDITRYEVRAYDLRARRLLIRPIVDPHDRGEAMTGFAIARVMSADARWAYTLYMRPSGVPFIHALDTVARRAVCVDLPRAAAADIGNARLRLPHSGATLVVDAGATHALVDTRTFVVTAPVAVSSVPRRPVPHRARAVAGAEGTPWELLAVPLGALVMLGAAGAIRAARRSPSAPC
jgi:hypothetical protein